MVKRYGDDAMLEALERADQLLDEGNTAGAETWQRIFNAAAGAPRAHPLSDHARQLLTVEVLAGHALLARFDSSSQLRLIEQLPSLISQLVAVRVADTTAPQEQITCAMLDISHSGRTISDYLPMNGEASARKKGAASSSATATTMVAVVRRTKLRIIPASMIY